MAAVLDVNLKDTHLQPSYVQLPNGPLPRWQAKETPVYGVKGSPWDILVPRPVCMPVSPLHSDVLLWPKSVSPCICFLYFIIIFIAIYSRVLYILKIVSLIASVKNAYNDSLAAPQVTLTAETDCSYITWPRRRLYLLLRKDRYIARLFSSHLGYDISEKLYSLNEKLFAKFGLRFDIRLPSLYHVLGPASSEGELEEAEELPCSPQPDHGLDGASEPPPQPPPPPPAASRPRPSRPESDLLGEDSTSLVLEDFAELPGSFMDYVSEGEYMK